MVEELPAKGDQILGAEISDTWSVIADTVSHRFWRGDNAFVLGYKRRQSFGGESPNDDSDTRYEILAVGEDVTVDLIQPTPIDFLAGYATNGWSLSQSVNNVQRIELTELLRAGDTDDLTFFSVATPSVTDSPQVLGVSAPVTDQRFATVLDTLESAIQDEYERKRRVNDSEMSSELEQLTDSRTPSPEEILNGCEEYLYTGFINCIPYVDENPSPIPQREQY